MRWVALIAAKDAARSVGPTVEALAGLRGVEEVWVVDDGSTDDTGVVAAKSGAKVLRLGENVGKGGALAAGVAATSHAERYLLADADLGSTAVGLQPLIDTHESGSASLVVGVLPSAAGRGGFGAVKRMAGRGIARACGVDLEAPLSGQRAVDGESLRSLTLASRFGVEVGMTIDIVRSGGSVREVPVQVEHRHTGRSVAGFQHRARQGRDIVGALIPRLASVRQRAVGAIGVALGVGVVLSVLSVVSAAPRGEALPRSESAVLFAFDHLGLADLERNDLPGLRALMADGVAGVLSVRTTDRRSLDRRSGRERPSAADAYASLGASARVRSVPALERAPLTDTGLPPAAMATARVQARKDRAASLPGALGEGLRTAGKRTAFVGGAQLVSGERGGFPAAAALADRFGHIDSVKVSAGLLAPTVENPGGRVSIPAFVLEAAASIRSNDVVLIDPGEMARAYGDGDRADALRRTDAILAGVREVLPTGATLVVFAPTPPGSEWELTPIVVFSDKRGPGTIASATTRRSSLGGLNDLAPTVLQLVGADPVPGMTGAVLRAATGSFDAARFQRISADGAARSRFFLGASVGYTIAALALYLLLVGVVAGGLVERWRRPLRVAVIAAAAFPVATLVTAGLQHWALVGGESPAVLVGVCAAIGGALWRWRGLTPLYVVAAGVLTLVMVDVAVTGPLHSASLLGYSLQTTGRFYGLPNASFAVFATSLVVLAAATAGGLRSATPVRLCAAVVMLLVGVGFVGAPWLGNDVGGTVALVPVAAALIWKWAGRRLTPRAVSIGSLAVGGFLALMLGAEAVLGRDTHLGRALGGGESSLVSTLVRRSENNLGLLVDQWWGFLVLAFATASLVVLAQGRLLRALPAASPMRAGLAGAVALSILAFAVNDSGPVVAVLCLVVAAPVVALRAIDAGPTQQSRR